MILEAGKSKDMATVSGKGFHEAYLMGKAEGKKACADDTKNKGRFVL